MTVRKETTIALLNEGLSDRNVHFIEDLIEIFTQKSEKLPETIDLPFIGDITGRVRNNNTLHIHGHPTSGKTALVSGIVNSFDPKLKVLWVDSIFSFSENLINNKDSVFVFQTIKLESIIDIVGNYGIVIIDDFASITDPVYITDVIGECKRNNTLLIALNQIRVNIRANAPRPMRANLEVLFDISVKLQRAENYTDRANYQAVISRHRPDAVRRGKYGIITISKQGKVLS